MPGNDFVIKQNVLGSAAGIALLAFALAWRFLPSFSGGAAPEKAIAEPPSSAPMSVSAPKETAPAKPVAAQEPPAETPLPAAPAKPAPPPPKAIAALLRKADKALADGRLVEPKDTSAFVLYTQVLDADQENAAARAGLAKIHDALLKQVNAALDRDDESDASRAIAQLELLPAQGNELESLRAQLKLLKQTGPLLTRAADLLNQGHATEPAGGNALAVYREVLRLDPTNKLAEQGLVQVQRAYLDRALAAAAQDDFSGADSILSEGSLVAPGSQELLDTRTRIEGIRRQRATNVLAQANSALDAGNADLAQLLAQKALGLSPDLAGVDQFNERLRNARLYASFSPGQIITDKFLDRSGTAPPLVVVPTGSFMMGSPDSEEGHRANEEPLREVKLAVGVALGRDDVTVAQFRAFASDADYVTTAEETGTSSVYDEESGRMIDRRGANWRDDYLGEKAADDLPVLHVSWTDAQAYVQWLSTRTGKKYRLPSEAEFEYALRAGTATRFPWGDKNPGKVYGNLTGDGDRSPHLKRSWAKAFPHYSDGFWGPSPVGSFAPSRFGLRDIEGNVSVWIEDCWHDNYTRAPSDSRAWMNPGCAEHVIRGASWGSSQDQSRSAYRLAAPSQTRSARVGIRVARDL
ncbi:MAG TPA: SUMF1/EgtB/PvdO family nonheme iron enzyme [Rudaea sp.]|nr:SUMF1/EgtB/PvdO family nonheme iron enzyme [Rudaea sp.]